MAELSNWVSIFLCLAMATFGVVAILKSKKQSDKIFKLHCTITSLKMNLVLERQKTQSEPQLEPDHTNSNRPPVGVWVYIIREGFPDTLVIRKTWTTSRNYNLIYWTKDGEQIEGDFKWRYC